MLGISDVLVSMKDNASDDSSNYLLELFAGRWRSDEAVLCAVGVDEKARDSACIADTGDLRDLYSVDRSRLRRIQKRIGLGVEIK